VQKQIRTIPGNGVQEFVYAFASDTDCPTVDMRLIP